MMQVKHLPFSPDIEKEKIQIDFSLKPKRKRVGVEFSICFCQSFIRKKLKTLQIKLGAASLLLGSRREVAFGETEPEGLHFAGPGAGNVGLLGEGDVRRSTTDFPALRDTCVFWRKKKRHFHRTVALQGRSHQLHST